MIYEARHSHSGKRECSNQLEVFKAVERLADKMSALASASASGGIRAGPDAARYTAVKFQSSEYSQPQAIELFSQAAVIVGVHGRHIIWGYCSVPSSNTCVLCSYLCVGDAYAAQARASQTRCGVRQVLRLLRLPPSRPTAAARSITMVRATKASHNAYSNTC